MQLLIKYALLEPFGAQTSLSTFGIFLLILSTICIAAAGNIINDIFDVETDIINKPQKVIVGKYISEKSAYNLFIGLNVFGVIIGFYLSNLVGKNAFFSIFVIISALLYVYATYLKQLFLIGNIIISILTALSLLIVGVFDLLPGISSLNQQIQLVYFKIIFNYALFAFLLNFLREIAKDIEDFDGDSQTGLKTLPIVLGYKRTTKLLFILSLIPIFLISYYVSTILYNYQIAVIYFIFFIIGPLLYLSIKLSYASNKSDMHHISFIYKITMFFGVLSLLLYKFIVL